MTQRTDWGAWNIKTMEIKTMKYIDADKLIAVLERQNADKKVIEPVIRIIASLQQEQPEVELELEKAYESYMESRKDDLSGNAVTVNMKDLARHFWNKGINARKEELPEIGLDKFTEKIKTFQGRYKYPESISIKGAMAFMARMFYQYPNVARKWYDSLPKATMDNARKEE